MLMRAAQENMGYSTTSETTFPAPVPTRLDFQPAIHQTLQPQILTRPVYQSPSCVSFKPQQEDLDLAGSLNQHSSVKKPSKDI